MWSPISCGRPGSGAAAPWRSAGRLRPFRAAVLLAAMLAGSLAGGVASAADGAGLGTFAGRAMSERAASARTLPAGAGDGGSVRLAAAERCGVFHRVARGETLGTIAREYYGSTREYRRLFEANRDMLASPDSLEVGVELYVPCRDGAGPATRAEAIARGQGPGARTGSAGEAPPPAASAAAVRPMAEPLRLLSGTDFAPFAHPALPEGGMTTELVRLAISRAAPDRDVEVTFVADWSSHPRLLSEGRFLVGFPYYRPDCTKAARLAAELRARCTGFVFSAPLFEVRIAYYVRAGDPRANAAEHAALAGARICRPANYFTFDLDQAGLSPPVAERVIAPDAATCFEALMQGAVDVVTLDPATARREISRLGLLGLVAEAEGLATGHTLHAIAPRDNPEALAVLGLIDEGLAQLKASGRWFEVVSRHLGAFGLTVR